MSIDCAVIAVDSRTYLKGDIQSIRPSPRGWGNAIVLPQWIRLTVTGVDWEQAKDYEQPWKTSFDFSVVNHNAAKVVGQDIVDFYRIDVFSKYPSASNRNVATQEQVENYLDRFGMVLRSANLNAIRFDYGIYETTISDGFLDIPLPLFNQIVFTETDYNQISGVHTIQADYSTLGIPDYKAVMFIAKDTGTVLDNANGVITYSVQRNDINARIKRHFIDKLDAVFERRKFRIPPATVDSWVSQGGVIEITKNELLAMIEDKTSV